MWAVRTGFALLVFAFALFSLAGADYGRKGNHRYHKRNRDYGRRKAYYGDNYGHHDEGRRYGRESSYEHGGDDYDHRGGHVIYQSSDSAQYDRHRHEEGGYGRREHRGYENKRKHVKDAYEHYPTNYEGSRNYHDLDLEDIILPLPKKYKRREYDDAPIYKNTYEEQEDEGNYVRPEGRYEEHRQEEEEEEEEDDDVREWLENDDRVENNNWGNNGNKEAEVQIPSSNNNEPNQWEVNRGNNNDGDDLNSSPNNKMHGNNNNGHDQGRDEEKGNEKQDGSQNAPSNQLNPGEPADIIENGNNPDMNGNEEDMGNPDLPEDERNNNNNGDMQGSQANDNNQADTNNNNQQVVTGVEKSPPGSKVQCQEKSVIESCSAFYTCKQTDGPQSTGTCWAEEGDQVFDPAAQKCLKVGTIQECTHEKICAGKPTGWHQVGGLCTRIAHFCGNNDDEEQEPKVCNGFTVTDPNNPNSCVREAEVPACQKLLANTVASE